MWSGITARRNQTVYDLVIYKFVNKLQFRIYNFRVWLFQAVGMKIFIIGYHFGKTANSFRRFLIVNTDEFFDGVSNARE